ncbi:MAG: prepilin-type N-terminal cleavage/methylation domain-containing protein [Candidatus Moraniibacteriota bacterium]
MRKKKTSILKGFTLIEMIVSMGVFVIMASVISVSFSSGFSSYKNSRDLQKDIESAQYGMNAMAKSLRTSTIIDPFSTTDQAQYVIFYDYSATRCYEYRFNGGVLEARWRDASNPIDSTASKNECGATYLNGSPGGWNNLTEGYVTGQFFVTPSSPGPTPAARVGRVTIFATVKKTSSGQQFSSRIQTTVSLRDYNNAGY